MKTIKSFLARHPRPSTQRVYKIASREFFEFLKTTPETYNPTEDKQKTYSEYY